MRVLIAAGGTGGHVYPALATASVLRDRGHEVEFAGGDRLEARVVPEAGFRLHTLPARGLPTSPSVESARAAWAFARSLVGARRILKEARPDVVVGMGGYPSPAPALAAGMLRVPVVLHEQNARLMLSHRISLRAARVLALSMPLLGDPPRRTGLEVEMTGNPLRPVIRELAAADADARASRREQGAARLGVDPDRTTVLIVGASQGAAALNRHVPAAVAGWKGGGAVQFLHLAGPGREDEARPGWARTDASWTVLGYLDTIEDAYACADLVVSRAGATTLAELFAIGLPAVLVPLPIGPYQRANAELAARQDAAVALPQDAPGFVAQLRATLERLCGAGDERAAMSRAARGLARPDADTRLASVVESLAS